MIRSNPTAIPLRPSDLKLLQVELDNRRRERDVAAAAAAGVPGVAGTGSTKGTSKTNGTHAHQAHAHQAHASAPGDEGVEAERRRRAGMSAQERIGL